MYALEMVRYPLLKKIVRVNRIEENVQNISKLFFGIRLICSKEKRMQTRYWW